MLNKKFKKQNYIQFLNLNKFKKLNYYPDLNNKTAI